MNWSTAMLDKTNRKYLMNVIQISSPEPLVYENFLAIDCALLLLINFGKNFAIAKTQKREYFTHYFLYFC